MNYYAVGFGEAFDSVNTMEASNALLELRGHWAQMHADSHFLRFGIAYCVCLLLVQVLVRRCC